MMTEAVETGATITALPLPADPDAAWKHYCALMQRTVANPGLLVDRTYCSALASAWTAFRDRMAAVQ